MDNLQWWGLVIGLASFIIIGLFHPLVIKAEYYFGQRSKVWFGIAGAILALVSLFVSNVVVSILLGVTAFSAFGASRKCVNKKSGLNADGFRATRVANATESKYYNSSIPAALQASICSCGQMLTCTSPICAFCKMSMQRRL